MARLNELLGSPSGETHGGEADLVAVIRSLGRDGTAALAAYYRYSQDRGIGAVALDDARQEALLYGQPLDHSNDAVAASGE